MKLFEMFKSILPNKLNQQTAETKRDVKRFKGGITLQKCGENTCVCLGDSDITKCDAKDITKALVNAFPEYKIGERLVNRTCIEPLFSIYEFDYRKSKEFADKKCIQLLEVGVDGYSKTISKVDLNKDPIFKKQFNIPCIVDCISNNIIAYHFKNCTGNKLTVHHHGNDYVIENNDTFWIDESDLHWVKESIFDGRIPSYYSIEFEKRKVAEPHNKLIINNALENNYFRIKAINLTREHGPEVDILPLEKYFELFCNGFMVDNKPNKFDTQRMYSLKVHVLYSIKARLKYKDTVVGYIIAKKWCNREYKDELHLFDKDEALEFAKKVPEYLRDNFCIKNAFGNEYIAYSNYMKKEFRDVDLHNNVSEFTANRDRTDFDIHFEIEQGDLGHKFYRLKELPASYWKVKTLEEWASEQSK